ncbi:MAG TPA: hypothetical protein PK867_07745 [Pirellulales bacterium]|nr:hypothetical protein [Pirellulales bacterium]
MQPRGSVFWRGGINDQVSRLACPAQIAGDHGHDCFTQPLIIAVILNDDGGPDLAPKAARIREIDKNDVAAFHPSRYFW